MTKRCCVALLLSLGMLGAQCEAAWPDNPEFRGRLAKVLTTYRCAVTADLVAIHSHAHPEDEQNRYLILNSEPHPEFYAQCAFFNKDRQIHCEAASGFYNRSTARFITDEKRAVLAQLGFSTDDSKGNFVVERTLENQSSLSDIAELLLATLVRVFDFGENETLMFNAPLLGTSPKRDVPVVVPHDCINVSELESNAPRAMLIL